MTRLSEFNRRVIQWIGAAVLLAPGLLAQASPHDVNARKFLKTAENLIRVPPQPNVQLALKPADDEVEAAIGDLDRGAHTSNRDGTVPMGAGAAQMTEAQRLRSIVDLLHSARREMMQETNSQGSKGPRSEDWRDTALRHISAALDAVQKAAIDAHLDREINSF